MRCFNGHVEGLGGVCNVDDLPSNWQHERFSIISCGHNIVALHAHAENCVLAPDPTTFKLAPSRYCDVSKVREGLKANELLEIVDHSFKLKLNVDPPLNFNPIIGKKVTIRSLSQVNLVEMVSGSYQLHSSGIPYSQDPSNSWKPGTLSEAESMFLDSSGFFQKSFVIVDAGDGLFAIHNTHHNRFVRCYNNCIEGCGGKCDIDKLPSYSVWGSERFSFISIGPNIFAIYAYHEQHTLRINHNGHIVCNRFISRSEITASDIFHKEMFEVASLY
jgi:hypothetical protein